jgi:4-hydroxybenzoate polyprenyltransferase
VIITLTISILEYLIIPATNAWNPTFWTMLIGTICIAAGGNIINDIRDYTIDCVNKPQKVIIHQHIPISVAWLLYLLLNSSALCLVYWLQNDWLFHSFYITIILLFFYSYFFKKLPLIGNIVVALLCAWVVVNFIAVNINLLQSHPYTSTEDSSWFSILSYYTLFAFLATLAREIVKDLEDQIGDKSAGALTLPIWLGEKVAKWTALSVLLLLFIILLAEGVLFWEKYYWAACIFLTAILLPSLATIAWKFYSNNSISSYHKISQYLKWYFLLGLVLLFLI